MIIEFFLIEKILDYINNKHIDPSVQGLIPYKHNQELEVKIRVFVALESILKEVRKSFLSFLIVDVKEFNVLKVKVIENDKLFRYQFGGHVKQSFKRQKIKNSNL